MFRGCRAVSDTNWCASVLMHVEHVIADTFATAGRQTPPPISKLMCMPPPDANPPLLLVDDDDELAALLAKLFAREGMVLTRARTIAEGHARWWSERPRLVILDLMLPDGTGLDLCRTLRAADPLAAILMLTARGDPIDRVLGLELGADDYLAKPFEARELLARVRALLRRREAAETAASSSTAAKQIEVGALTLDLLRSSASVGGHDLVLTAIEFRLLAALAQCPGQAVDRDTLANAVQPGRYRPLERAVDVQVARLRRKLRATAAGDCVRTVRGEGYALVPPPAAP